MSDSMLVEIGNDQTRWDAYVASAPGACNYHRWTWRRAIEDTYGHEPFYLAAVEGGAIQGILPLFRIKSRLFGTSLVSVPFFSYGGFLADTPAARDALLARAAALAGELRAHHVELRQGSSCETTWRQTSSKVSMEIPLPEKPDQLWKRLSTGMRNKIRNGQKQGLRPEWGGLEAIDHFYPVFAANMRNLGTPVYPKAWFQNLWRCSPESVRMLILWDGAKAVAGAFLVGYGDTLELPWSASLPESRKKYAPVLLYWTFLEWAIQEGYKRMDVGRCTPGGGTYEFKRHWPCEERVLNWYYWTPAGKPLPQLKPENIRFRAAVELWKHLPLPVANGLGPLIVRSIP
jgi:serine/alanine adding enzyme